MGTRIVCGTYETPSEGVEEALERIGKKLKELRLIKGVNDFTEAEEKELDELRTRVAALKGQLCVARLSALEAAEAALEAALEAAWAAAEAAAAEGGIDLIALAHKAMEVK